MSPLGKAKVMHPTEWARVRPFHDVKVWGGRFNNSFSIEILVTITSV